MSNLGGFLFGNLDDSGRLEGDIDDELRESLEKMGDGSLAPLLGNIFNIELEDQDDDDESKSSSKSKNFLDGAIRPAANAIDYTDFEELAKEEIKEKKRAAYEKNTETLFARPVFKKPILSDEDDNYDDEEPPQPPVKEPISIANNETKSSEVAKVDIKKLYPAFEKDAILKFSSLFVKPAQKKFKVGHNIKKIDLNAFKLPEKNNALDTKNLLDDPNYEPKVKPQSILDQLCPPRLIQKNVAKMELEYVEPEPVPQKNLLPGVQIPNSEYLVNWENWEDDIIWDADDMKNIPRKQSDKPLLNRLLKFQNNELEDGDWDERIIWDCDTESPNKICYPLTMDLNDTNMLFDIIVKKEDRGNNTKNSDYDSRGIKLLKKAKKMGGNRDLNFIGDIDYSVEELDRYNLSNDLYYEATKDVKNQRVRQTFGMLVVQHSLPSLQLHPSYFKTRLTKTDLRSFHRPRINFPLNTPLTFSKVHSFKKKKGKKVKDEFMSSCKDLTLKDNTNMILIEYSEQFPPILPNTGMGSILVNYYRKKNSNDQHVPESDYGEPIILDLADATPFLNFGNVEPGETISGLYNGLIRAPLFRQKPKFNDFLLVKHTFKNKTKYYLRNIPVIFVSGQTYPVTEVPGPHSRKITSTIKNRLQVAAFRLIKKSPFHRLDIASLVKRFPEYSEPQIRQRLKEFTEFHRKGSNSGHWSLKPTIELPDEEKLRQMLTPETICLYESMLAGQRHLQDSGYGRSVEDDDNEESMSKLDIEEQLAPWITTRNFVNASQGKAMLRLYGEGDPTARGEGFNLIRVSMKDIFLREGESAEEKLAEIEARPKSAHRYNVAEQQQIYREEITRIWNAQKNSLGSEADFNLSEDETDELEEKEFDYYNRKSTSNHPNHLNSPSISMSDKQLMDDDDDISVTGSILSRTSTKHKNKILTIKRRVRDTDGNLVWKQQIVRNTAVIQAYLRNRRIIEESLTSINPTQPTTETERQQLLQKRLKERLDMLKSSIVQRSDLDPNTKKSSAGGTIPTHLPNKPRKELIRRCGNCGQLGHMKTNRKCPMFKEMSAGGSSPGVSTPDSFGKLQHQRSASQDPNPHGSNVPSKLRIDSFSVNDESNDEFDIN